MILMNEIYDPTNTPLLVQYCPNNALKLSRIYGQKTCIYTIFNRPMQGNLHSEPTFGIDFVGPFTTSS